MKQDFSFSPFSVSSMKVSSIGRCYFSAIERVSNISELKFNPSIRILYLS